MFIVRRHRKKILSCPERVKGRLAGGCLHIDLIGQNDGVLDEHSDHLNRAIVVSTIGMRKTGSCAASAPLALFESSQSPPIPARNRQAAASPRNGPVDPRLALKTFLHSGDTIGVCPPREYSTFWLCRTKVR